MGYVIKITHTSIYIYICLLCIGTWRVERSDQISRPFIVHKLCSSLLSRKSKYSASKWNDPLPCIADTKHPVNACREQRQTRRWVQTLYNGIAYGCTYQGLNVDGNPLNLEKITAR